LWVPPFFSLVHWLLAFAEPAPDSVGCLVPMPLLSEKLNSSAHLSHLREVVEPICAAHGVVLVDARFANEHGFVLKVLIERPGADAKRGAMVSLEDCRGVSRDLSTALDVVEGVAPDGAYRLEVGSPGLDRPLLSLADFARFTGESVRVQTRTPVAGRRRFSGKLVGVEDDAVKLEQDGQLVVLPHAEIAKANLVPHF
jgi:ribosome maturation factor RimP